jgi:putative FmdB family regulatory protein
MPIYGFTCASCGDFEVQRSMSEASALARCPDCRTLARRVFTAPGVRQMTAPGRNALEREERSRHEPARASEVSGRPMPHVHGAPSRPWMVGH